VPSGQQQQRSLEKVQKYLDVPVGEDDLASNDSKAHRQWLMRIWNKYVTSVLSPPLPPAEGGRSRRKMELTLYSSYFHDREIDPDTIWIGLCEGSNKAAAWSKAFFSDYVEHSVKSVMVLGPAEYADRRMVNSASTVLAMWRKLVKEADQTVLEAKRRQQIGPGDKWRLRFHGHNARFTSSSNVIFEVSTVSLILLK
jgi:hypothetical protein